MISDGVISMTYAQAVNYLKNLRPVGMQMGLERMQHASKQLLHPEAAYPCVHIAGTNGKGSTSAMIASMLTANGYNVGLYTSPMVTDLTDMIVINERPVSEDRLAECITKVATAVPQGLSEYECLTMAAFLCFQLEHVDIAVIECCLGGETDATNILPTPLCAVFTPIALDHTGILGDTVEKIATCKSGIIKPSCDVVCAPTMTPEALGVLYEKAYATGSTVYQPQITEPCDVSSRGTRFLYQDHAITLNMLGAHQQENAYIALEVMNRLAEHGYSSNIQKSIYALQNTALPCRQEIRSYDPFLMLDGAHNPHGINALCESLKIFHLEHATLIIGMLADKDVVCCLRALCPFFETIICCTPINTTRALSAKQLAVIANDLHPHVTVVEDPIEAYLDAKKASVPIVIGGSFYTASAVRRFITSGASSE